MSYLRFEEILPVTTKTKQWELLSESSRQRLGEVRWYAPWRRYCFYPGPGAIFDAACLKELHEFIHARMQERKALL